MSESGSIIDMSVEMVTSVNGEGKRTTVCMDVSTSENRVLSLQFLHSVADRGLT